MLAMEKRAKPVGTLQRVALRKIGSNALEDGREDLMGGSNERGVCYNLGLPHELFEGSLLSGIEEALWERGRL